MKRRLLATLIAGVMVICSVFFAIEDLFTNPTMHTNAYENVEGFPDFDMDLYVADLLTNSEKNDILCRLLLEYMINIQSPNSYVFDALDNDADFKKSLAAWEDLNAIFEPGESIAKSLDEQGYYEAIILNALNTTFRSGEFYTNYVQKAYKGTNSVYSYFCDNSELVDYIENFNKLTDDQVKDFGGKIENIIKKSFPNLDNATDHVQMLFSACDTAYDFIEKIYTYQMCSEMSLDMKNLIHSLYNNCDGTTYPAMKKALSNIADACDNYLLSMTNAFADVAFKATAQTMAKICDGFIKECISYFPAGKAALLSYAITKSAVNFVLSTDKIKEQYYKMKCLFNFEQLIRSTLTYTRISFIDTPSKENAGILFTAVDVFFKTLDISCDFAEEYAKIIYEDSLAGKLLKKRSNYNQYIKMISKFRAETSKDYYNIKNTYYLDGLRDDYPEIYEAYCKQNNKSLDSYFKLENISFEKSSIEIGIEDDYGVISPVFTPSNALNTKVSYMISNPEIVKYYYGLLYPEKVGTTQITVTAVTGISAEITVNIVEGHGEDGVFYDLSLDDREIEVGEIFVADNIKYEVLNATDVSVVKHINSYESTGDPCPADEIHIPSNVSYCGKLFNVTEIRDFAFSDCVRISILTIPESVTSIGNNAFCEYRWNKMTIHYSGTAENLIPFMVDMGYTNDPVFLTREYRTVTSYGIYGGEGANMIWYLDDMGTLTIDGTEKAAKEGSYPFDVYSKLVILEGITDAHSGIIPLGEEDYPAEIVVDPNNQYYSSEDGVLFNKEKTLLRSYPPGKTTKQYSIPDGVTAIKPSAFWRAIVESVIIPNGVTSIGEYAFSHCLNLSSITIPDSVTSIGECAFEFCSSLTSIYGYKGSTAQAYAKEYDLKFMALDNETTTTASTTMTTNTTTSKTTTSKTSTSKTTTSTTTTKTTTSTTSTTESTTTSSTTESTASTATSTTTTTIPETTTTTTETTKTTTEITTTTTTNSTTTLETTTTTTTTTFTETILTTSSPSLYKTGDINQDGIVGIGDAVLLCRIVSEDGTLVAPTDVNLDVNTDGIVNIQDAIRILQLLCPNSITVSKTSAQSGDTVTVEVKLHGYHPSAGGVIYIEYDPLLTPTAIRWNEELDGFHVQSAADCYPAYFCWTTKDGKNQTIPNGTVLAYIDFEVSEYATDGKTLEITPCSSALSDENGREITLSTGSGFIAVAQK